MRCSSCNRDNIDDAKFCKYCGKPLNSGYKTCPNGHKYNAEFSSCPHCPASSGYRTIVERDNSVPKTTIDNYSPNKTVMDSDLSDKTIIDKSIPVIKPVNPSINQNKSFNQGSDKTVIFGHSSGTGSQSQGEMVAKSRKLVGWLVTYDINPNGTDYRLYEGRTRIGKNNTSDIILAQPGVSEDHALLLYREGKFIIQDQLSTNGTFINGESIDDKVILKDNDEIMIGSIKLKIKII